MYFNIKDRVIGVASDYKGLEYVVIEVADFGTRVRVSPIIPIDVNSKAFNQIYTVWIYYEFFELDKQYYRNIKINEILI